MVHCSLVQEMEGPSFVGRGQGRKQADLQGQPQGRGGDHNTAINPEARSGRQVPAAHHQLCTEHSSARFPCVPLDHDACAVFT